MDKGQLKSHFRGCCVRQVEKQFTPGLLIGSAEPENGRLEGPFVHHLKSEYADRQINGMGVTLLFYAATQNSLLQFLIYTLPYNFACFYVVLVRTSISC